jgi:hypothetical protein
VAIENALDHLGVLEAKADLDEFHGRASSPRTSRQRRTR